MASEPRTFSIPDDELVVAADNDDVNSVDASVLDTSDAALIQPQHGGELDDPLCDEAFSSGQSEPLATVATAPDDTSA